MTCPEYGNNYFFVEDGGNKYCFSYGQNVAAIIKDCYIEYDGNQYFSVTSNKHKAKFRRFYNIEKPK